MSIFSGIHIVRGKGVPHQGYQGWWEPENDCHCRTLSEGNVGARFHVSKAVMCCTICSYKLVSAICFACSWNGVENINVLKWLWRTPFQRNHWNYVTMVALYCKQWLLQECNISLFFIKGHFQHVPVSILLNQMSGRHVQKKHRWIHYIYLVYIVNTICNIKTYESIFVYIYIAINLAWCEHDTCK